MTFLITCSGSKKIPNSLNKGSLNELYLNETLFEHRIKLIELSCIKLDWSKTLPAYELYSGPYSKIYKKISQANWKKNCVDIKILSALFGWIRHTDLIPYYDLKMTELKGNMRTPAHKYWLNTGSLLPVVKKYDIDLLSANYKKAIDPKGYILASKPEGFVYRDRGDCVGYWLENSLSNITCND